MHPSHLLAAALLAAPALAQDTGAAGGVEVRVGAGPMVRPGSEVVGTKILNQKDETLGTVEDLVVHPHGDVSFAVVSGAGWIDAKDTLMVVPWPAMRFDEERSVLVLNATADQLKDAPRFDKTEWPKLDGMEFWHKAAGAFGKLQAQNATPVDASARLAPAKMLFRYDELEGREILTPAGETIGQIREVAIDPKSGRINFVVLAAGGFLGTGEKQVAVPWQALKPMPDPDNPQLVRLTLNTTEERLEQAPEFRATRETWQKPDPQWMVRLYQHFGVAPYWDVDVETGVEGAGADDRKDDGG